MKKGNYQVVILVGGIGERLYPITKKVPKPMVEINGKPFLEIKLEQVAQSGIRDVILCIDYLGHIIEDHFKDGRDFGLNISYARVSKNLGTGGAIKNAEHIIRGDFIAMNGDTYASLNLVELITFHEKNNNPITMLVTRGTNPKEQELVEIEGNIIKYIYERRTKEHASYLEKTANPLVNGGHYVIKKEVLDIIPRGKDISLENSVFPKYIGKMTGFVYRGYFKDIGTKRLLEEFIIDYKNEKI